MTDGNYRDTKESSQPDRQPLQGSTSRGTLTAIMIVRNECANVKHALDSLGNVPDQIIVNDTGSTDGTQQVLESLGVEWFQTAWQDDFSLARNQCLERAASDWIFWLDADDRISSELQKALLDFKNQPTNCLLGFEVVNTAGAVSLGARFLQIRMFPNSPMLRFRYKIHEQIEPAAARLGLRCLYHPLAIYHKGYEEPSLKKGKAKRNLRLILQDGERLATDPAFAMSLGEAYFILERWEDGVKAFHKVREIPNCKDINREIFNDAPTWVGFGLKALKNWPEARLWLEKGLSASPHKPEPRFYLAEVMEKMSCPESAAALYREIIALPKPLTGSVNRWDSIHMHSFYKLADLQLGTGRYDKAKETIEQMRLTYPLLVEPFILLGRYHLACGNSAEAIRAWMEGLKLNPAATPELYERLLAVLKQEGKQSLYNQCLALARKHFEGKF